MWKEIQELWRQVNRAWAVMGDFNCVLNNNERIGSPISMAEIREFRNCVGSCGLQDLKFTGAFFTWCNKQIRESRVYNRIDRVLVNSDWDTMLPTSKVHYMNEGLYDHCPAIIRWEGAKQSKRKKFKYFYMWSKAAEFKEKVHNSWRLECRGRRMLQLYGKLNRLKPVLQMLNRKRFTNVEAQAEEIMKKLIQCQKRIQRNPYNKELIAEEREIAKEYILKKKIRDNYLQQKSKINWILKGDQNTKFHYNFLKARRNVNRIFTIKDKEGTYLTNAKEISKEFIDYYNELLRTANEGRKHANSGIIKRGHMITEDQKSQLTASFTARDVKKALWR
ncbi:hypothetical protein R3W88_029902 [Solanum pinnatisectum]|uniref:Endonuclease/exonuclease/phosphatase domain-containing protein n=1 Tax=Solanum pinnatisectum TaxID=50273 RepID=A0AAV9K6V9_9SOLN|nr:hypothetical protein R3W88_029902 [Solanum pinnatisectum]